MTIKTNEQLTAELESLKTLVAKLLGGQNKNTADIQAVDVTNTTRTLYKEFVFSGCNIEKVAASLKIKIDKGTDDENIAFPYGKYRVLTDGTEYDIQENTSGSSRTDVIYISQEGSVVVETGTPGAGVPTIPETGMQIYQLTVPTGTTVNLNAATLTDKRTFIASGVVLPADAEFVGKQYFLTQADGGNPAGLYIWDGTDWDNIWDYFTGISPIPVTEGGTGLSTLAAGRIPYGAGSNPIANDPTFKYDSAKKILHVPTIISSRVNPLKDLDSDADLYRVNNLNLFGSLSSDTYKWYGGVLAPNGKIYGIPYYSTQVLEIDPVAGTTNLFGSLSGTYKWIGGVLAPNGKIYGIPHNSTQVLEIDPVARTTNLLGSLSSDTSKWYGGVLAPNGKIYGIPFNSTQVLEIDPEAGTTTLFGSLSDTAKWFGGVLAPNGKIYGIPYNSTQVLEIDPAAGTTNLFGSLSGPAKWAGGVLAPNGKIYGIPYYSTQVLEIDPVARTTTLFGSLSDTAKWFGGVLAPNGKIYGIPYNSTQVLEIDPAAGTTNLFGSLSGTYKWIGGVLAPNGKIYGIPHNSTQVLEIGNISGISPTWELSAYLNKF